jgi:serine-type D-Ala-D-Ala carboxypeptidase (penicillin-binding protein 5/6)
MLRPVFLVSAFIIGALLLGLADRFDVRPSISLERPVLSVSEDGFTPHGVTAISYVVFDVETGDILGERLPSTQREMASITKLITADVILSTSTVDSTTTVSWRAVATDGRAGSIVAGKKYRVRELLFPLLLESSNDAAEAIAEAEGRAAFIALMNSRVRELGMASTTVIDPTGLGRGNVTTAYDLRTLLLHLMRSRRHVLDITTLSSYVGEETVWQNNDPILSSEGFLGGKHGYTETAGRTIALVVEDIPKGAEIYRQVGIVLLDSDDLSGDVARLRTEYRSAVHLR